MISYNITRWIFDIDLSVYGGQSHVILYVKFYVTSCFIFGPTRTTCGLPVFVCRCRLFGKRPPIIGTCVLSCFILYRKDYYFKLFSKVLASFQSDIIIWVESFAKIENLNTRLIRNLLWEGELALKVVVTGLFELFQFRAEDVKWMCQINLLLIWFPENFQKVSL